MKRARMAVVKKTQPAKNKPDTSKGRRTSSTSSAEPAAIPTGGETVVKASSAEEVKLTYGAGAESKTYDLHPDWDNRQIIEVLWIDAVANAITEWLDLDELEQCQPCETLSIGYLLKDHPEWITIVGLLNDSSGGHAITIPRGMILAVRQLHR